LRFVTPYRFTARGKIMRATLFQDEVGNVGHINTHHATSRVRWIMHAWHSVTTRGRRFAPVPLSRAHGRVLWDHPKWSACLTIGCGLSTPTRRLSTRNKIRRTTFFFFLLLAMNWRNRPCPDPSDHGNNRNELHRERKW